MIFFPSRKTTSIFSISVSCLQHCCILSTQSKREAEVVNNCEEEMRDASTLTSVVEGVGVCEWLRCCVAAPAWSVGSSADMVFSSHQDDGHITNGERGDNEGGKELQAMMMQRKIVDSGEESDPKVYEHLFSLGRV
jgi:hypothetical protein